MITILSTLLGFLGAAFPEFFKMLQDKGDKKHEIEILKLQIEQSKQGHSAKMDEIGIDADARFFEAAHQPQQIIGIGWVDALNATVRPVLAYSFFLLYASVKAVKIYAFAWPLLPWQLEAVWGEEDMMIFCSIIGFYFGSRAMKQLKKG